MNKQIRVGLVGYGYAGKTFHAPVLTTVYELKLAKVVQRSGTSSKEHYPWVELVRDVRDLYEDESIDLVVITTPSTHHYEFVKDALLAGKHVVVEKPFTTTTTEADELIAIANERGLVLSVFHNRRWDGDFKTVREVVRQGLLGRITDAEFRWDRYHPQANPGRWRDSGAPGAGVFYDLGVHFLDQALMLFGTPQTIRADIRAIRDGAVADDCFDVTLTYAEGAGVRLKSSLLAREPAPRYTLHGTNGSFVKYGEDPQEHALRAGQNPASSGFGTEPEQAWGTLNTTANGLHFTGRIQTLTGSYQDYYHNVYQAITGESELAVKPEQARMAIRLLELGVRSSNERRTIEVTA